MRPRALAAVAVLFLVACGDNPGASEVSREACAGRRGAAADEVRLEVGGSAALTGGRLLCLVLPQELDAEYVLAYVDARPVEAAKRAPEPALLDSFRVTLEGLPGASARAARIAAGAQPGERALSWAGSDVLPARAAQAAAGTPAHARRAPWSLGEAFTVRDEWLLLDRPARVHRIFDGWLVVAAYEDAANPTLAPTLEMLDAAWPDLRRLGLPLLDAAFGGPRPVTSTGSGQLLVLLNPDLASRSYAGVAHGAVDAANVYSWLEILPNSHPTGRNPVVLASLVMHEMAHAWQRAYLHHSRPFGSPISHVPGASVWGVEGGAALMQRELARRQAGVALTANLDWRVPGSGEATQWYVLWAQPAEGVYTGGYTAAAGFLNDLAVRRVAAGEPLDAALGEVSRGAVEGWYGRTEQGAPRRTGLAARMRARLGDGWEPADALLTWTLSHAMDDRTASAVFQAPGFRDVWDVRQGEFGWAPEGHAAAGAGAPIRVKERYGSPGFFTLTGGGAFFLTADVEDVRWTVARVR